jgi:hypothetical protein
MEGVVTENKIKNPEKSSAHALRDILMSFSAELRLGPHCQKGLDLITFHLVSDKKMRLPDALAARNKSPGRRLVNDNQSKATYDTPH